MEAHPVPQNVTSFEFRLVGDMTLKQFGYLASGLIVAYLTFIFLFATNPYIASPIIAISALLGTAFAFLPINDRPLDHWVKAFFKAVYNPTQRAWESNNKSGLDPKDPVFKNRLRVYLNSTGASSLIAPEEEIMAANLTQQSNVKIKGLSRLLAPQNNTQAVSPRNIPVSYATPAASVVQPQPVASIPVPVNQTPSPVIENSLTSTPNIITGVVIDQNKNPLEGAIVIINNANQVPVRALKTNRLGQFLGATPLPSGIYEVTAEKDGMEFTPVNITLNDTAVTPVFVSAREVTAHA